MSMILRSRPGINSKLTYDNASKLTFRNEDQANYDPLKRGWKGSPPLKQFRHMNGSEFAWKMVDNEKHVFGADSRNAWHKSLSVNNAKAKTPDRPEWRNAGRRVAHWSQQHKSQRQEMVNL